VRTAVVSTQAQKRSNLKLCFASQTTPKSQRYDVFIVGCLRLAAPKGFAKQVRLLDSCFCATNFIETWWNDRRIDPSIE
jgi:hypothetical protein